MTVVGGGRETIQCSSRGAHPCQHLVYLEDLPASCSPDALVWIEGCASDKCRVRGTPRPDSDPVLSTSGMMSPRFLAR